MRNSLRYIIVAIFLLGETIPKAQENVGSCEDWDVVPYLYNDSVSKQSEICFWKNYWYGRDDTDKALFPDTLIVCMHLVPNTVLWEKEITGMGSYHITSQMLFKFGEKSDSYNLVNARCSRPFQIMDSVVDFESIFSLLNRENVGYINIAVKKIPMKKALESLNIFTNVLGESIVWVDGVTFILNQIIIQTQIYRDGEYPCRRFEFILPVNGPYCD